MFSTHGRACVYKGLIAPSVCLRLLILGAREDRHTGCRVPADRGDLTGLLGIGRALGTDGLGVHGGRGGWVEANLYLRGVDKPSCIMAGIG